MGKPAGTAQHFESCSAFREVLLQKEGGNTEAAEGKHIQKIKNLILPARRKK